MSGRSSKNRAWRVVGVTLVVVLAWMGGCATDEEPDGNAVLATHDDEADPAALQQYEGKFDGNPCADHPGGTLAGDDLLLIVNKEPARQLRSDWVPPDLVPVDASEMMPGRTGLIRATTAAAYYEMADAAAREAGIDLGIRSGYRSYATQCFTFNYKVETSGIDHANRYSARPGRSEHQLGTGLDITSPSVGWEIEDTLGATPVGQWLAANAHRFGFVLSYPEGLESKTGYGYEPWHWRYIGRDAAAEASSAGLTAIDYLLACERGDAGLRCPREDAPAVVPNAGFIGGSCASVADCASLGPDALCLKDGYPNGLCSLPCTRTCPDRPGANSPTFCVVDPVDTTVGACHSRCDAMLYPATACREGYACVEASRPSNAGVEQVCLPAM